MLVRHQRKPDNIFVACELSRKMQFVSSLLLLLPLPSLSFLPAPQILRRTIQPPHLFGRGAAKDVNGTAVPENVQGSDGSATEIQQEMAFPILNTTQEADLTPLLVNITDDDTDECLLLDDNEKSAILSQRQAAVMKESKETKKSVFRGWISSFVSFFVVISVGMIGTLWEATSPAYLDTVPRPTPPRVFMRDASLDDDDDSALATEEERGGGGGGDEVESSSKSRERHVTTTRRMDPQRALAISYVKDAVQKVSPSVLRIDTETHLKEEDGVRISPGWLQEGQGSGVIFSAEGLVLTNAHVVDDTTKVSVTLADGRSFRAQVAGSDEVTDIAVLKILTDGDAIEQFPVAEFGDSDTLEVGQFVVALGSPGGLDMTATMGIVSGLRRSPSDVGLSHKKVDYIQTDAALNPGNSGGPLVDVENGCVVGINACIRSNMEGTSFSIPINKVQEIIGDLAAGRPVSHSYIGAAMADCTPSWARQVNANNDGSWTIPEVHGAFVSKVFPDSPAGAAGLQMNDVIIDIGGTKITSSEDASRCVDRAPVGKELVVRAIRDGKPIDVRVRPVDLATRLKAMRADRQRQKRRPRKLLEELLPLQERRAYD